MATFTLFDEFYENLGVGNINLDGDTFKAALSNTAFDDADADELADITQIAEANGYTTGGVTLTGVTWAETSAGSGVWQWTCDDFEWTVSGGSIVFRYIPIYSDTSTGDKLVGYIDAGTEITVANGFKLQVDIGADGLFQIGNGTIS